MGLPGPWPPIRERASYVRNWAARRPNIFPALRGLCTGNRARGRMHTASALADQLIGIARRSGDPSLLLEAHHVNWTTQYALGKWRSVCEHTDQGLFLYRPEHFSHAFVYGGHDSGVCAAAKQGISLWMLGFPDQALARARESITRARQLPHPPSFGARTLSCQRPALLPPRCRRRLGKQRRRGFNWRTRYFRPGSTLSISSWL